MLLVHVLLALAWAALWGEIDFASLVVGFVLGYLALALAVPTLRSRAYVRRVPKILAFTGWFLAELVLSNVRVARLIVSPNAKLRPAVLAVPIELVRPRDIALFVNLVSLTPGSLSIDVSADRRTLWVHAAHAADVEGVRASILEMQRRVKEIA